MFGSIVKSISGVAKKSLGSVSKVRSLMDFNPLAAGLVFPPQVSMGLKVASIAGDVLGIKIPSEQDLIGLATGEIDKVLGGIKSPISKTLDQLEDSIQGADNAIAGITNNETINKLKDLAVEEVLQSVDWLL